MTIKPAGPEVCWEPVFVEDHVGYWHDEDRWPHYSTRAKCAEAIADIHGDRDPDDGLLLLIAAPCYAIPCVILVCDDCGEEFDYEGHGGGMHFDPADPMPVPITDCEWTVDGDRHYCPECPPNWCDQCDEQHHGDCPAILTRAVPVIPGQMTIEECIDSAVDA
jgi:hypothetical protein